MSGSNVSHEIADCMDCLKHWEGEGARKAAYQHSRATGHRTSAEVVMAYNYGGLPKRPRPKPSNAKPSH